MTLITENQDSDGVSSFDAVELGLEDSRLISLVDVTEGEQHGLEPGTLGVTVHISEDTRFHGDLDHSTHEDAPEWWKDSHVEMFTEDNGEWEPTEATWAALVPLLESRYGAENVEYESGCIRFQLYLAVPATTTVDELGNAIWEDSKLVDIINECDPGTFGSPYLFGSLIEDALKTVGA